MQGKERDAIKLNYVIPTKYSKIKSNSLFRFQFMNVSIYWFIGPNSYRTEEGLGTN